MITNRNEARNERSVFLSSLSLTHLFLLSYTLCLVYLCLSCVLGYGWKRLDFDSSYTEVVWVDT